MVSSINVQCSKCCFTKIIQSRVTLLYLQPAGSKKFALRSWLYGNSVATSCKYKTVQMKVTPNPPSSLSALSWKEETSGRCRLGWRTVLKWLAKGESFDFIHMPQYRDQWQAFVIPVMNLWVLWQAGSFLSSWVTAYQNGSSSRN
jgi:hypothetical protein